MLVSRGAEDFLWHQPFESHLEPADIAVEKLPRRSAEGSDEGAVSCVQGIGVLDVIAAGDDPRPGLGAHLDVRNAFLGRGALVTLGAIRTQNGVVRRRASLNLRDCLRFPSDGRDLHLNIFDLGRV